MLAVISTETLLAFRMEKNSRINAAMRKRRVSMLVVSCHVRLSDSTSRSRKYSKTVGLERTCKLADMSRNLT